MSRSFIIDSYNNINNDRIFSVAINPLTISESDNDFFFFLRATGPDDFRNYTASIQSGVYNTKQQLITGLYNSFNNAVDPAYPEAFLYQDGVIINIINHSSASNMLGIAVTGAVNNEAVIFYFADTPTLASSLGFQITNFETVAPVEQTIFIQALTASAIEQNMYNIPFNFTNKNNPATIRNRNTAYQINIGASQKVENK